MKHMIRVPLAAALCAALLMTFLTGCGVPKKAEPQALVGGGIIHEPEFGGVYIDTSIEDFNALGYEYGDSVTVSFSNGYTLTDLPYYNGYYTKNGEPLLVAYPGYPYIKVAINNGADLWEIAELQEGDTAEVRLEERGKYADVQEARDIHYTDDREDYADDAVFANFRSVTAGDIPEGRFYRSASPCDNQHNRAPFVDALMKEASVRFILNLSDNEEKLQKYMADAAFASPYFLSLYEDGAVEPIALNMNYGSPEFRQKIADGLIVLTRHEGPYLTHCTEGKDRTGFVCMLLEALCGATYGEIVDDYMTTYDNYYGITQETEPAKYQTIVSSVLDPMIASLIPGDDPDPRTADLAACAEQFLLSVMTQEQVAALKTCLTAE